jgi:hypothetical protein
MIMSEIFLSNVEIIDTYKLTRRGPRTNPWGNPFIMVHQFENLLNGVEDFK